MKCIIGGTFGALHSGHTKLFQAAFAFDEIEVGLTSDEYVKAHKQCPYVQYEERRKALASFIAALLKKMKLRRKVEIIRIPDKYGFAPYTDAEAIIVSPETAQVAAEINRIRANNRRAPLRVVLVPFAYAEDYIKISVSRIISGKITANGKRLKPVVFALGTLNPSKKQGLESAAKKLFKKFRVEQLPVKSDIDEQPFEQETLLGAENRARSAYFATDADFGIGFESGIFKFGGRFYDIAVCAVFDGEGTTFGNSMGFQMPDETIKLLSKHKDLGSVMEKLSGVEKIGYKKGAIHYLSNGLLDRQQMNEQAFLCAMIPRISEAKGIFRYF